MQTWEGQAQKEQPRGGVQADGEDASGTLGSREGREEGGLADGKMSVCPMATALFSVNCEVRSSVWREEERFWWTKRQRSEMVFSE